MARIRIRRAFYEHRKKCGFAVPVAINSGTRWVEVDTDNPSFADLVQDARAHQADDIPFQLRQAADALLTAVHQQADKEVREMSKPVHGEATDAHLRQVLADLGDDTYAGFPRTCTISVGFLRAIINRALDTSAIQETVEALADQLWERRSTKYLERQVERLQWAADTTDDPLWRKQHLRDKEECLRIIARRRQSPDGVTPGGNDG